MQLSGYVAVPWSWFWYDCGLGFGKDGLRCKGGYYEHVAEVRVLV